MQYVCSLSYGKDSAVIPELCLRHDLPLDRIVTADIWATPTIPADMPKMVEWKAEFDEKIFKRYGIKVEHHSTHKCEGIVGDRVSFEECFYRKMTRGKHIGTIKGFPMVKGNWCTKLKLTALSEIEKQADVVYLGICADEPKRVERLKGTKKIALPAQLGYTEADCYKIAKELGLLSPIYEDAHRGGCWFCHNQGIDQLRKLRKNYPEYWALMLKWDNDSPVTFKPDGHTVHDFDRRFALEDDGFIDINKPFRWNMLDNPYTQLKLE